MKEPETSTTSTLTSDEAATPLAAYELLARAARLTDLAALTTKVVSEAARSRVVDWAFSSKVKALAEEAGLSRTDADTKFGNALDVLSTGGEGAAERALAAALWAHALGATNAESSPSESVAGDLLWLATHTAFDATMLLDRALGDEAAPLWVAIGERIRRIDQGEGGALGRGEAVLACASLGGSSSTKARELCRTLSRELRDPVLVTLLTVRPEATPNALTLNGEFVSTERGPVLTSLLAFTGLLFAVHAASAVARVVLRFRRPAEVTLTDTGIVVKTRTEMLGRVLREREHVVPSSGLVRVAREVRFPSLAFYTGLLALAVGSYVGVRAFVDGVRSASPSLLLVGIAIVAAGITADFALRSLIPTARGRCRVLFVPTAGHALAIAEVDSSHASDILGRALGQL
jgi:hypothetical protein